MDKGGTRCLVQVLGGSGGRGKWRDDLAVEVVTLCKSSMTSQRLFYTYRMELESDTYDVVVIGTGLAQSIAAAYVD